MRYSWPNFARKILLQEVEKRGWSARMCDPGESVVWITDKKSKTVSFRGSRADSTGANAVFVTTHKALSYYYIASLGVSIPPFMQLVDAAEGVDFLHQHAPIVVKPNDQEAAVASR